MGFLAAAVATLALLPLALSACAAPSNNLGGDPCLLQQYQKDNDTIVQSVQGYLHTVTSAADALGPGAGAINPTQDFSETQTALAEFHYNLQSQWHLVQAGAQPSDAPAAAYRASLHRAIDAFDRGTMILTEAYVDAQNQDTLAAKQVAMDARDAMHQGRVLLATAYSDLSKLKTFSANC